MRKANSFQVLGRFAGFITSIAILTTCSAKELEHFERIRRTFESVDKQKQGQPPSGSQTIEDALEALNMGNEVDGVGVIDGPVFNDDGDYLPANGKGKSKQSPDTTSTTNSESAGGKGKGKTSSSGPGGKLKNKTLLPSADDESDSWFENYKPGMKNGRVSRRFDDVAEDNDGGVDVNGEDEYVVRTDHLKDESK